MQKEAVHSPGFFLPLFGHLLNSGGSQAAECGMR